VELKKSGYKSTWVVGQKDYKTGGCDRISKGNFTCEPEVFTINTEKTMIFVNEIVDYYDNSNLLISGKPGYSGEPR